MSVKYRVFMSISYSKMVCEEELKYKLPPNHKQAEYINEHLFIPRTNSIYTYTAYISSNGLQINTSEEDLMFYFPHFEEYKTNHKLRTGIDLSKVQIGSIFKAFKELARGDSNKKYEPRYMLVFKLKKNLDKAIRNIWGILPVNPYTNSRHYIPTKMPFIEKSKRDIYVNKNVILRALQTTDPKWKRTFCSNLYLSLKFANNLLAEWGRRTIDSSTLPSYGIYQ